MSKQLTVSELRDLVQAVRELFAAYESLREQRPIARLIKQPQIPSALSESLAHYLLSSGRLGVKLEVSASSSGGDLELATSTGRPARLEVKATSESGFQELRAKDIAADLLLWLHFDGTFRSSGDGKFYAFLLPNPGMVFPSPKKIMLEKFLEVTQGKVMSAHLDLD